MNKPGIEDIVVKRDYLLFLWSSFLMM